MKKLRNDRGETLIEVMASILIATMSVALLYSCFMVSSKVNSAAKAADEAHYDALTAADAQDAPPIESARVTIDGAPSSTSYIVNIYGDAGGGLYSYKRK